ncbi:MAG: DUF6629 family protein [Elusimicrobiota bacterium]
MCFSAPASFTAGVLLTFIGTETLKKVHKPSQIVLASMSLFFAFQQFTEGVVWLTIGKTGYAGLEAVTTYIFVIMAQVLWPILIPFSVLLIENNKIRKKILSALLAVGTVIGLYYLYRMVFYGVHAGISKWHIIYRNSTVDPLEYAAVFVYLIAAITPFFISSIKRIYIIGIIMGLSFIVSVLFYTRCLTSVWCFFAAVISFMVFYIIRDAHKKFHFDKLSAAHSK